jgi:RHS repeat-associated protein
LPYVLSTFGIPEAAGGPYPQCPTRYRWLGRIGYWWEPDTSQYDVRRRRYDPARGRWISYDVLLNHVNRFLYAWNSPMAFVDLSGLEPVSAPPTGQVIPGSPSLGVPYEPIAQSILRDPRTSPGLPQATGLTPLAKSIVDYMKRVAAEARREAKALWRSTITFTGNVDIQDPKHLNRKGKLCGCEWHLTEVAVSDTEWPDRVVIERVRVGRPAEGPIRYGVKSGRPVSGRKIGGRIPVEGVASLADKLAAATAEFEICRGACATKEGRIVAEWQLNAALAPYGVRSLGLIESQAEAEFFCWWKMKAMAGAKGGQMPPAPTQPTIGAPIYLYRP